MITEEAQAVLQDLDDHKFAKVKEAVRDMHYADVAELFESIEDQETAVLLFRLLPKDTAAEVFSYMESENQEQLLTVLTDNSFGTYWTSCIWTTMWTSSRRCPPTL